MYFKPACHVTGRATGTVVRYKQGGAIYILRFRMGETRGEHVFLKWTKGTKSREKGNGKVRSESGVPRRTFSWFSYVVLARAEPGKTRVTRWGKEGTVGPEFL